MKIGQFPVQPKQVSEEGVAARAIVHLPVGSRVLHLGAAMDSRIFVWAEVPEVESLQIGEIEFLILNPGHKVPDGYRFRGAILSNPMLFFYQQEKEAAVAPSIITFGGKG